MNSKSAITLIGIFILQTVSSCCFCDPVATYDLEYQYMYLTPINTLGFSKTEATDSVFRNSFGLEASLESDLTVAANSNSPSGFGFSTAAACSCNDDIINVLDPVSGVDIFIVDEETNEQTLINSRFNVVRWNTDGPILMSLTDFFEIRPEWRSEFMQFQLVEFSEIPKVASFKVDIILESGQRFSEQTTQITFID